MGERWFWEVMKEPDVNIKDILRTSDFVMIYVRKTSREFILRAKSFQVHIAVHHTILIGKQKWNHQLKAHHIAQNMLVQCIRCRDEVINQNVRGEKSSSSPGTFRPQRIKISQPFQVRKLISKHGRWEFNLRHNVHFSHFRHYL